MATDGISAALAVRSSVGLELWRSSGLLEQYCEHPQFARDVSKFCRAAAWSPDGRFLAWVNGQTVNICSAGAADWPVLHRIARPRALYLRFSPAGNFLTTFEQFFTTKDNPTGSHNLHIYDANTGTELYSVIQKNLSEWEPVWSADERLCALLLGGEVVFYEPAGDGGWAKAAKRVGGARGASLSVAPNVQPAGQPYVAFCVPGTKGQPTQCKIYRYPDVQAAQPVAFKSFFQADSVAQMWNRRGNGLLLLTSTDVDATGASYYGKQALHFMSTRGDSYSVQLAKEGTVHDVAWNPNSTEFAVTYGFMPARTTFYNMKCDAAWEAGEGDHNSIYYNDFGTLVILGGFGNLGGKVEVWDVVKRSRVCQLQAPDTTLLEWSPNGQLFVTATTAPRLRVGNCFKVWHYSGSLLHETLWPVGQELLQVVWQRFATGTFQPPAISTTKVPGIKSAHAVASSVPYRPPGARGLLAGQTPAGRPMSSTGANSPAGTTLADAIAAAAANGGGGGAKRGDRRTERNKARAVNYRNKMTTNGEGGENVAPASPNGVNGTAATANGSTSSGSSKSLAAATAAPQPNLTPAEVAALKRRVVLTKKLSDIRKLKARKERGEHLEINQVAKIAGEAELQREFAELCVSSSAASAASAAPAPASNAVAEAAASVPLSAS